MLGASMSPRTRALSALALAAAITGAVLAGVSACSRTAAAHDTSRAPVQPAAAPTVTIDPVRMAAQAQVMSAYESYIEAETVASQRADYGSRDLAETAGQPVLGQWVAQLYHLHVIGDVQRGTVVSANPQMTILKSSGANGTAVVTDCLDDSSISIVNASTGTPMKLPPHNSRYRATTTLYLLDGRWRVCKVKADRSKPC